MVPRHIAAPDLLNCAIDILMSHVCEKVQGISLGNYHITDLDYANDTVLFAESPTNLKSALHIYSDEATKIGLRVNWVKTKLMHVGEGCDPPSVVIGGQAIEFVSSFNCLSSLISNMGSHSEEIYSWRNLAAAVMNGLWKPLWQHPAVSKQTKLWIYRASILSILTYASDIWPISRSLEKYIAGFDSHALCTIKGIKWPNKISNPELYQHRAAAS